MPEEHKETQELGREYLDHILASIREANAATMCAKMDALSARIKLLCIDAFLLGMCIAFLIIILTEREDA